MKKQVIRTPAYLADLDDVEFYIAEDNAQAGRDMWHHINDQVLKLADPNFPRRDGRVDGTMELVAHENYIVVLIEDATLVTVLNVINARQQWPKTGPMNKRKRQA